MEVGWWRKAFKLLYCMSVLKENAILRVDCKRTPVSFKRGSLSKRKESLLMQKKVA